MGTVSNSRSLRYKVSLRTPYQMYLFGSSFLKVNFCIYSVQKIYSRFLNKWNLFRRSRQSVDGFNFSFTNSGEFCFSLRVFDKPRFFPGFYKKLKSRPKVVKFLSMPLLSELSIFSRTHRRLFGFSVFIEDKSGKQIKKG